MSGVNRCVQCGQSFTTSGAFNSLLSEQDGGLNLHDLNSPYSHCKWHRTIHLVRKRPCDSCNVDNHSSTLCLEGGCVNCCSIRTLKTDVSWWTVKDYKKTCSQTIRDRHLPWKVFFFFCVCVCHTSHVQRSTETSYTPALLGIVYQYPCRPDI